MYKHLKIYSVENNPMVHTSCLITSVESAAPCSGGFITIHSKIVFCQFPYKKVGQLFDCEGFCQEVSVETAPWEEVYTETAPCEVQEAPGLVCLSDTDADSPWTLSIPPLCCVVYLYRSPILSSDNFFIQTYFKIPTGWVLLFHP